ncbi:hypothetical protein HYX14_01545 [Candidatus Woesearchaeota archaeon]|nr:hypothetical protein [Candidatus Woesearchaeota archaeon]
MGITLIGTIATISRLGYIERSYGVVTGALPGSQNGTGTSTLTVIAFAAISNDFNTIQFGSGYTNNSGGGPCVMATNNKAGTSTSGMIFSNVTTCVSFNNSNDKGFLLENTGNVNISVNYTCSGSCIATTFIGGATSDGFPFFELAISPKTVANHSTPEVGSNDTAMSCGNRFNNGSSGGNGGNFERNNSNINQSYFNVSVGGQFLCGSAAEYPLESVDTQDAFVINLNVSLPRYVVPGGAKTATFTFNAFASG